MLPSDLAKSDTEHAHQRAFFQWLNFAARRGFVVAERMCNGIDPPNIQGDYYPELRLMHAIPNGGLRAKSDGAKLKAEGVKAGVLDTFLPVPKTYSAPASIGQGYVRDYVYHGLYVEFKEPSRREHKQGGMSDAQVTFAEAVRAQGYCVRVAYTWAEAANAVMLYYGVDTRFDTT